MEKKILHLSLTHLPGMVSEVSERTPDPTVPPAVCSVFFGQHFSYFACSIHVNSKILSLIIKMAIYMTHDLFRFDGSMLRFSFRPSTRSEPTIAVRLRFSSTPTTRIASRAIKVQKCKRKKMEKRENLQEENMLLDASTCFFGLVCCVACFFGGLRNYR